MNLSEHFTLDELTLSQTAARRGISNVPSPEVIDELRKLCVYVLQPLRHSLKSPIVISSGYRSPELNRAVGGAKESDHTFGRAADISVPGLATHLLCRHMVGMHLPFKQLIDEFGAWVHVSIELGSQEPRRQTLTARRAGNGRTVYAETKF